jgi:glycosyltransferase involved in cell wall biosynthesis/GT2 family glycosyltransferase
MTGFDQLQSNIAAITADVLDTMFWQPSRLGVESAWYGHVPFAHWLVATHRPASIVELGAHNGVSYAAFCEAILRCNLGARALAVDTWQGDEHAGLYDDSVYRDLCAFHDRRYASFSTLLRSTFDNALQFVPDGSVDLLHIDGRHRYEDVAHDFHSWRPKLSARAIVLFHDTNVREREFGVWRLWTELCASHAGHFEFLHGHGLGVLQPGEAGGDLDVLCHLSDGTKINRIRDRFAAMGERWIELRAAEETRAALQRVEGDLEATRKWAETAQSEVNRLFPQHQQLIERARIVRADLAQARFELSAHQKYIGDLQKELAQSREAEAKAHALNAAQNAQLTDAAARQAAVEQQKAELERQHALLAQKLPVLEKQLPLLEQRIPFLEDRLAEAEKQLDAVIGSASWRLTAPFRRLSGRQLETSPVLQIAPPVPPPALTIAPALEPISTQARPEAPVLEEQAPAVVADPVPELATFAKPRVLFISGEDHTPGHVYRVERYVDAARRAGFDARAMPAAPVGPSDLAGLQLVVLWRVSFSAHINGIINFTHEQGGLVVFDVDDLMFRPELAVADIIDGIRSQNFSEFETQALFQRVATTLRDSDFVTCPTEELAQEARQVGKPAYVLPNGFDNASHAAARAARLDWVRHGDEMLRIGYAGGSRTHQRDFAIALPAIARLLREMPDLRLTLFRDPSSGEGLVLIDEFAELAELQDRIEWRDMVSLADLPKEIARFSVNIAPLEPRNPFCEAKSELKFFEAALAGVPTVASPTGPFARAILQGQTGFLAETEDEWYEALRTLLKDDALRKIIARDAYHVCLAKFGPEARARAFGLMVAQMQDGAASVAAFERERYQASLSMAAIPHLPESETIFSTDRQGDAPVTVIVPLFNYADYVSEALASVVAQTLEKIDLVIVEDRSTDDSSEMALAWAQQNAARFNRLRIVRHTQNAGLGFGRNTGFAWAETDFVLPLDADNRLRPSACEVLLRTLSQSQAAFAYPAIQQFGDKGAVVGKIPFSVLRLQAGNYIDAMALVRKSAWAAAGGYDHVQFGWEDYDFWCRLVERGHYGICVPEILADYRVHDRSMLHKSTDIKENRAILSADMRARHTWLNVA